jgi:hypothetical protein
VVVLVKVNPVICVSLSGWGVYEGNQVCGFDLCLLSFIPNVCLNL